MSSFFHAGAVLDGRFKLGSALGEGAMGTVWLAKDLHLGIDVAVKVMQSALRADGGRREMFEKEAELCARMLSPHIVRVLSYGVTSGDVPYIIYEALEGEPLDTRIAIRKKLELDETEEIIVHVARALARAHSMGIVHKDIKPGNVFMTKDDRGRAIAKVIDFGISEVIQPNLTIAGELCGTLEYMPLEVLRDAKPADARADLFALAVLAYECLCGEVPYVGESMPEVMQIMSGAPPSLSRVFPEEVAVPLDQWMRRGLAPDAGLRFQSARDLAETFHHAVKEAKFALGVSPASSRKMSTQMERVIPPNNVDRVTAGASRASRNSLADAAEQAMRSLSIQTGKPMQPAQSRGPRPPPPMMSSGPSKVTQQSPSQQSRAPQAAQPSRAPQKVPPPVPSKPASPLSPLSPPNHRDSRSDDYVPPAVQKVPAPQAAPKNIPPQALPPPRATAPSGPGSIFPQPRPAAIPREEEDAPKSQRATITRDTDKAGAMRPRAGSFIFDEEAPPVRPKQESGVAVEERVEPTRIADKRRE